METLEIKYELGFKDKLMDFLNSFDSSVVEIVTKNSSFESTQKRVQESYEKLSKSQTKLYDIDELEAFLDKTISEYEN